MTLITLKFSPDTEKSVIEGRKCCTTRDKRKGNPGDVFRVCDRLYRILSVDRRMHPYECSDFLLEGFDSWDALNDELERIYPRLIKPVESITDLGKPGAVVFVHFFAYVTDVCQYFNTGLCCPDGENCPASEVCNHE